jgi:predicted CXXCH cytochrome family protein
MAALAAAWFVIAALTPGPALGKGSIINSPHNLSASGAQLNPPNTYYFVEEQRICIFCHAPHNVKTRGQLDGYQAPLWNREPNPNYNYIPYVSDTMQASLPGQPTGSSRLCLSCHDGTIALGSFGGSSITRMVRITGPANLTTDLSDDHPISFPYPTTDQIIPPTALPRQIKLEGGVTLQCTSCHDPHDNEFGNFLVLDNKLSGSPLCVACHNPSGWTSSSHNPALNPALTGCMHCHAVHNATVPVHLLKDPAGCTTTGCHDGTAGSGNILAVVSTNVTQIAGPSYQVKSAGKIVSTMGYHACTDCHNPHQANSTGASRSTGISLASPLVLKGALKGVKGTSNQSLGTVISLTEFEICYRCHSGGAVGKLSGTMGARPNRMITEPDQMKRFDRLNPSFHPVAADRRTNGASLLSQYQASMIRIACSDCHNSDQSRKAGGNGPNGPHGSRFEHILMAQYSMPPVGMPNQGYTPVLYDLCFRCHSEGYIMGFSSGFVNLGVNEHATHVKVRGIPCYVCHDPHGVPQQDGATATNNAGLINFDRSYTVGGMVIAPVYTKSGPGGSCTVNCHTGNATHSYMR